MLRLTFDRLKGAYREYLRDRIPSTRTECPPPSELMLFFSSRSSRRRKSRLLEHVSRCGPCAEEFEMMAGVDRAARLFAGQAALASRRKKDPPLFRKMTRGFWEMGRIAAAGAGFAVLTAGILLLTSRPSSLLPREPVTLRSPDSSIDVRLVSPSGRIGGHEAIVFRWRPVRLEQRGNWVVSLFDDSLARVWEIRTDIARPVSLPREIQARLVPGRRYFWGISLVSEGEPWDSDLEVFWLAAGR